MSDRQNQIAQAMPAALDLEKGVLSCVLQAPEYALAKAQELLQPDDFHIPAHRLLWILMTELGGEGRLDPLNLQQLLLDRKLHEEVGGPAYVTEILTFAPTPAHVAHYATQIRGKSVLRRITHAAYDALSDVQTFSEDPDAVLQRLEQRVLSLREERAADDLTMTGREALFATIDRIEAQLTGQEPDGVPWGLPKLDEKTGGICPGLTIIGAETSGGKSVLAMQAAVALLRAGKHVDFYTLEMPIDLCVRRFLACIGNLPFSRLRNPVPTFSDGEHHAFQRALQEFGTFANRLWMCADGGKTATAILTETRRKHAGGTPVGAVIVDYVQRLTPEDPRATSEKQITDASRSLKRLADALTIPVITPVQLNDTGLVRGSRMLGMDADVYLKISHARDEDGNPFEPDSQGRRECMLWVEKNRNGERWSGIDARLDGARMRFEES